MSRPLNLLVGIIAVAQGVMQLLAAVGIVKLDSWPFVTSPNRWLRFGAAGGALLIGVILIATAW